jgi:hypothetical protein
MLSSAALDRCGGSRAGARARSGRPHISGEWLPPNTKAVLGLVAGNKLVPFAARDLPPFALCRRGHFETAD